LLVITGDYGLRQVPIEMVGKNPKTWPAKGIIETSREYKIRAIFVQPQFFTKVPRGALVYGPCSLISKFQKTTVFSF
jgi:hypothetical protein